MLQQKTSTHHNSGMVQLGQLSHGYHLRRPNSKATGCVCAHHRGARRSRLVPCSSQKDAEATSPSFPAMHLQFGQPEPDMVMVVDSKQHRQLPKVDWSRYHLQVLFIDRSDQLRARLAAGLFEKVAEWNGYGRALYPWTCGTHVDLSPSSRAAAMSSCAGLMSQAVCLGIPPKLFARSPEAFELRDLDGYDVVVALDSDTREEILSRVDEQHIEYYRDRVNLLSDYAQQQPLTDAEVLRRGGLALLPRSMSQQLQQDLDRLRHVVDVDRPCLADASPQGVAAWNWMVLVVMLGSAGLVRYLIDAYPPDLPEYDPL